MRGVHGLGKPNLKAGKVDTSAWTCYADRRGDDRGGPAPRKVRGIRWKMTMQVVLVNYCLAKIAT